jgi:hypothetical protein
LSAPSQPPRVLELPYRWAGTEGEVRVEIRVNEDPAALGCAEFARGFPYCRATVEPPARGYADALGWVQLVDQAGGEGAFAIDPFSPLGDVGHPFGFFGFAPTFFDAPHNDEDWDFLAHAFLCGLGGELLDADRDIRAVLGFSWGFTKRGDELTFFDPAPLAPADWDRHLDYLSRAFPTWTFAPGFRQDPLDR